MGLRVEVVLQSPSTAPVKVESRSPSKRLRNRQPPYQLTIQQEKANGLNLLKLTAPSGQRQTGTDDDGFRGACRDATALSEI
jgi:hypothetical protein